MEYVNAFNTEDTQAVIDAYHPNAPSVPNRDNIYFRSQVTVDDFTVVERSSDSAIVRTDVTLTDDNGDTESVVHTYELRPNDGEWDIYYFVVGTEIPSTTTETSSETERLPRVTFAAEYEESQTEETATGVLTITHTSGDTLSGSNIRIQGEGITANGATTDVTSAGTEWAIATGDQEISAGDSITIGVQNDFDVRIVWKSGDRTTVLERSTGPAA